MSSKPFCKHLFVAGKKKGEVCGRFLRKNNERFLNPHISSSWRKQVSYKYSINLSCNKVMLYALRLSQKEEAGS